MFVLKTLSKTSSAYCVNVRIFHCLKGYTYTHLNICVPNFKDNHGCMLTKFLAKQFSEVKFEAKTVHFKAFDLIEHCHNIFV